ncbi:hypothetical protein DOTSEDRAFT_68184 [Dothistroma septosporum NZE10]|uniref:Uncharacterized protein n=1 Tax=Dothistroma septosporum (strain NZE10 / CBS 128990) TaxID=675120 RepID=N1Q458_DOTSN|nr:hypothetical protein DOTSEDRAFT_68184 [Dothistroma septosporum NZE10]
MKSDSRLTAGHGTVWTALQLDVLTFLDGALVRALRHVVPTQDEAHALKPRQKKQEASEYDQMLGFVSGSYQMISTCRPAEYIRTILCLVYLKTSLEACNALQLVRRTMSQPAF